MERISRLYKYLAATASLLQAIWHTVYGRLSCTDCVFPFESSGLVMTHLWSVVCVFSPNSLCLSHTVCLFLCSLTQHSLYHLMSNHIHIRWHICLCVLPSKWVYAGSLNTYIYTVLLIYLFCLHIRLSIDVEFCALLWCVHQGLFFISHPPFVGMNSDKLCGTP